MPNPEGSAKWLEEQCKYDLESELYKRNVELFAVYIKMKNELRDNYYTYIDYKCPWFTDHGIKHCEQIIKFTSDMLSKHLTYVNSKRKLPKQLSLTSHDIFILLSAILWHDIGMLLGRDDHGANVTNFISAINDFVKDEEMSKSITNIAAAHSSNYFFNMCDLLNKFNMPTNGVAYVQEKLLASILRLADEVSENKFRVTTLQSVINEIPSHERIYWEHAKSICLSHYDISEETIEIRYQIPSDNAFKKFDIIDKDGSKSEIGFYHFIASRICKVYRELELCTPFFKDYISVKRYQVELVFEHKNPISGYIKKSQPIKKNIDFLGYTKNSPDTLQNFYTFYPEFNPQNVDDTIKNFLAGV